MAKISTRDKDIISKSFRMLTGGTPPGDLLERFNWNKEFNVFSSATGDNRYFNTLPQFSPSTDPRYGRMMTSREGSFGTIHKQVFEDNVTTLTMTPGVAEFAGLLPFISNMFDVEASIMANKGRMPSTFFYITEAITSFAFWPMHLITVSSSFLNFLMNNPKNKFYSIKAAMGTYIGVATGVLNDVANKLGYIKPVLQKTNQEQPDPLHGIQPDYNPSNAIASLSQVFPDVINKDGTIDLLRLITRGGRKHRFMINKLAELDNNSSITTVEQRTEAQRRVIENVNFNGSVLAGNNSVEYAQGYMNTVGRMRGVNETAYPEVDSSYTSVVAGTRPENDKQFVQGLGPGKGGQGDAANKGGSLFDSVTKAQGMSKTSTSDPTQSIINKDLRGDIKFEYNDNPDERGWANNILDVLKTGFNGSLDAITMRVDSVGSVTDSFSNTATQSPMADKFNSVVKQVNDFKFDVAGGNTGISIIDGIISTVSESVQGVLSGSVLGSIPLALANNAYIKIPDHWESSSVSLHRESYSFTSICNYAHPYEQMMKIWVPFSIMLPLVAGMSAGAAAHTSPFLVKAFCKSRSIIRTGMIENMRFTFGEGEAGWTRDRKPLNLRIEWDVVDLDPLVSLPINRRTSITDFANPTRLVNHILNDDTQYSDYLNRLTGLDYLDTVLRYSRLSRQLTAAKNDLAYSVSSANLGAKMNDSIVGQLGALLTKQIAR